MRTRQILIILAALLVVGAVIAMNMLSSSKKPAERIAPSKAIKVVKTQEVIYKDLQTEIELTGRLSPRDRVELYSEVSGVLKGSSRAFKEGTYYKKGELLANIDDQEHTLNVLAQKSSLLNQLTLMMPDLRADYPGSFPDWEQFLNAFDIHAALPTLPETKNEKEKYFISARNIYNQYYTIKSQEARTQKYKIRAPFNGVVTESNINPGTLVRVGQKLGAFINPSVYELEAAINANDLDFIRLGNTVVLSSDDQQKTWRGKVVRISDKIDTRTQTVKLFISVSGKGLKEGMYLSARVKGRNISQALQIPRTLMVDQSHVYVVKDSSLLLQQIVPVQYSADSVIVKGLTQGTQLLYENVVGAYDGMKVGTY